MLWKGMVSIGGYGGIGSDCGKRTVNTSHQPSQPRFSSLKVHKNEIHSD